MKQLDENQLSELRHLIDGAQSIIVTCHRSPDGDALGSSLALSRYLKSLGKEVTIVIPDAYPDFLMWLPGTQEIVRYDKHPERASMLIRISDLIFCLDYNGIDRVGDDMMKPLATAAAPKVLIDHHLNPTVDSRVTFSFPDMSSTSEAVFHIIDALGGYDGIDSQTATCIYCGMMTDTGAFTYNSASPEVYNVIARLLAKGINKDRIYNLAMNTSSADRLRLLGYALSEKMQVFPESHAALITLTKEELDRFNYKKGDTESLVNMPLQIPEVQWSIFLRDDETYIKVSARSQGEFAVNTICEQHFNGGGHKNAAGGEFIGSMSDAVAVFMSLLPQYADPNVNNNNKTENK